jgi:hypothetical protein
VLMFQGWMEAQKSQKTSVTPAPPVPNRSRFAMPDGAELIQTT